MEFFLIKKKNKEKALPLVCVCLSIHVVGDGCSAYRVQKMAPYTLELESWCLQDT